MAVLEVVYVREGVAGAPRRTRLHAGARMVHKVDGGVRGADSRMDADGVRPIEDQLARLQGESVGKCIAVQGAELEERGPGRQKGVGVVVRIKVAGEIDILDILSERATFENVKRDDGPRRVGGTKGTMREEQRWQKNEADKQGAVDASAIEHKSGRRGRRRSAAYPASRRAGVEAKERRKEEYIALAGGGGAAHVTVGGEGALEVIQRVEDVGAGGVVSALGGGKAGAVDAVVEAVVDAVAVGGDVGLVRVGIEIDAPFGGGEGAEEAHNVRRLVRDDGAAGGVDEERCSGAAGVGGGELAIDALEVGGGEVRVRRQEPLAFGARLTEYERQRRGEAVKGARQESAVAPGARGAVEEGEIRW
eukprot:ctg_673.g431